MLNIRVMSCFTVGNLPQAMKRSEFPSRTPNGIWDRSKAPVPLRMSAEEHEALERLASAESRSKSSMARLVFLHGLETWDAPQGEARASA